MTRATNEKTVSVAARGGSFQALLVTPPEASPVGGIVVANEGDGIDAHARDVCRRLAREGFAVVAPELFRRSPDGTIRCRSEVERGEPVAPEVTRDEIAGDMQAALELVRPLAAGSRLGAIGLGLGGFVAFLAACHTDVGAAVTVFGDGLARVRRAMKLVLHETRRPAPVLSLVGARDADVRADDVGVVRARLSAREGLHQVIVYPHAGRGFLWEEEPGFHGDAAKDAWARIVAWFRQPHHAGPRRRSKPDG